MVFLLNPFWDMHMPQTIGMYCIHLPNKGSLIHKSCSRLWSVTFNNRQNNFQNINILGNRMFTLSASIFWSQPYWHYCVTFCWEQKLFFPGHCQPLQVCLKICKALSNIKHWHQKKKRTWTIQITVFWNHDINVQKRMKVQCSLWQINLLKIQLSVLDEKHGWGFASHC